MPVVSVLLPVRDARPYLARSLASLWHQSFRDFEVIAVDDGSTDGSGDALERAARREQRLVVVHTPARGLPAALTAALARAQAALIARHDADDWSHPRRLEIQHAFLRDHPATAVVGSRIRMVPAVAVGAGMRRWERWHNSLLTHEEMVREMLIDSPLAHGTAVLRRHWLESVGGWTERGWPEDLDLWLRLRLAGARFAKRPEVLYSWRQHGRSATRRDPRYRPEAFIALKREALARGVLDGARRVTLVGVGESLRRWRRALSSDRAVDVVEARHPHPLTISNLRPPIVLVFGALGARKRWREALEQSNIEEGRSFVFIA